MTSIALSLAAAGGPQAFVGILPILLIMAVFYLMLVRPNQKRQKQWQEMLNNLKPGDRVTTTGGIRGTIAALREDTIQLKLPPDSIRVEVAKSAIASVTTNTPEDAK